MVRLLGVRLWGLGDDDEAVILVGAADVVRDGGDGVGGERTEGETTERVMIGLRDRGLLRLNKWNKSFVVSQYSGFETKTCDFDCQRIGGGEGFVFQGSEGGEDEMSEIEANSGVLHVVRVHEEDVKGV